MRASLRLTSGLARVEDLPLTGFSGGRDGMNELNHGQPECASAEQYRLRGPSMLSVTAPSDRFSRVRLLKAVPLRVPSRTCSGRADDFGNACVYRLGSVRSGAFAGIGRS